MKLLKQNKKGVELTLQTIVIFIILIIVLIVIVYFFTTHYGDSANTLFNAGDSVIENAKVGEGLN